MIRSYSPDLSDIYEIFIIVIILLSVGLVLIGLNAIYKAEPI